MRALITLLAVVATITAFHPPTFASSPQPPSLCGRLDQFHSAKEPDRAAGALLARDLVGIFRLSREQRLFKGCVFSTPHGLRTLHYSNTSAVDERIHVILKRVGADISATGLTPATYRALVLRDHKNRIGYWAQRIRNGGKTLQDIEYLEDTASFTGALHDALADNFKLAELGFGCVVGTARR